MLLFVCVCACVRACVCVRVCVCTTCWGVHTADSVGEETKHRIVSAVKEKGSKIDCDYQEVCTVLQIM